VFFEPRSGPIIFVDESNNVSPSEVKVMPLLVTAAVIFAGEKVLITRRPDDKRHPGLWEFPGGKVDPGESPEEALTREIREELGAGIQIEGIYEVVYYCYDWGPVLILAYRCRLLTGTVHDIGVAEHRWVYPADLINFPILPADQPILCRLNKPASIE
jgi:8-oxo-dGTP diphosphatase